MMYTKQELDVVGTYDANTIRDEDLLCFAKYMYKEGLLKASVKYDPDTDSNVMEYRVTVVRTYRDKEGNNHNSSDNTDLNTSDNLCSEKKVDEHRNFFKRIFNL